MDRRGYLKSIFFIGGAGITCFSIFKWNAVHKHLDASDLHKKIALLGELVDLIIPETDTPGAKSANVQQYVINVIVNCNSLRQQRKFYSGLLSLETYALETYLKTFFQCDGRQKSAILLYFSDHAGYSNRILNKINYKIFGEPFYSQLRRLTVEGYCISYLGATQGLSYDYTPGEYKACIPLNSGQKSWATK